jgi:hypothetical protein
MTRCIFLGGYHHLERTYLSTQVAAVLKKEAVSPPKRRQLPANLTAFIIIQYKQTKCTISKLIYFLIFLMYILSVSYPEGSSSGRRFYIQEWYSVL